MSSNDFPENNEIFKYPKFPIDKANDEQIQVAVNDLVNQRIIKSRQMLKDVAIKKPTIDNPILRYMGYSNKMKK